MEGADAKPATARRKLKHIDWLKVKELADASPGEAQYVGIMDQSMRTHIRKGRIAYIKPGDYDVWTTRTPESRIRVHLFIRRKCDQ